MTTPFHKGAQHVAPKEQIAQQQCIKIFGFSKPNFIEIIVLDESTSALDVETEAKIIESILKMKEKLIDSYFQP